MLRDRSVLFGALRKSGSQDREMSCRMYGMDRHPYLLSYAFAVSLILDCEDRAGLTQMDALSEKACEWMRTKNITKVIMNPPYATNAHPIEILKNVLTSVNPGTKCAFILPDTKLEKPLKNRQILKYGVLEKIVKLPSRTFSGVSDVSVFIFSAGQNREQGKIFTCWIQEDGLATDRGTGERIDADDEWTRIEDEWVTIIRQSQETKNCRWIYPEQSLRYSVERGTHVQEKDFRYGMIAGSRLAM